MSIENRIGKTYWFDLPATDMEDARAFYEGLFGWRFSRLKGDVLPNYLVIQSGEVLIGGLRQVPELPRTDASLILYFTVGDVKTAGQRVKDLGGSLVGSVMDLGEGRGLYQWFRDREGNLVALFSTGEPKETM